MKTALLVISTSILLTGFMGGAFAASPAVGAGGTINFDGNVVETACAVDTKSQNQNISLGEARRADMAEKGDVSTKTSFSIVLAECDPTIQETASFGFTGQVDSDDPQSLINLDTGTDAASKVGVQLMDTTGAVVPLDGTYSEGTKITLNEGENTAHFSAYMIATALGAKAGSVHSTVDFKVQYE